MKPKPGLVGIVDESARSSVIDQLFCLVDELSAQEPLFENVSESILSENPVRDSKSVKDYYLMMLVREENINAVIVRGLITGDLSGQPVDDIMDTATSNKFEYASVMEIQRRIIESRRSIVSSLRDAPLDTWKFYVTVEGERRSLFEWTFRMTLEDADTLREISARLSEIQMIFRR